jgi:bifunctional UDP-N-acetylglucosamine pyrophosphorylase/glucosamine-1-phosphate N-acetyltransferase
MEGKVDALSLAIVILATESGKDWGSKRLKALHTIGGRTLVAHVAAAAAQVVAPADIFIVAGEHGNPLTAALSGTGAQVTPHAGAMEAVSTFSDVVVLPGDLALIRPETIKRLVQALRHEGTALVAMVADGKSTGIFAFRNAALLARLSEAKSRASLNASSQARFTAVLEAAGERVAPVEAHDAFEALGAQSIPELMAMDAVLRARTAERLMLGGVTIYRAETCVFDADVEVGADTVIESGVQLLGRTRIGSECVIRSGTVIENSTLADGVLIRQSCVVTDSEIGSGAKIGPFAHLRPGSEIGQEAHVGNFVETKKARLGKGAKANHLSYLGDAVVGAGSNIGAGVITCNYDGVHKHTTTIGAGAFVGSDSTLVAPVTIGDGAYVGAGSCITREVPANSLSVARSRQVTKEGWASARRQRRDTES